MTIVRLRERYSDISKKELANKLNIPQNRISIIRGQRHQVKLL